MTLRNKDEGGALDHGTRCRNLSTAALLRDDFDR